MNPETWNKVKHVFSEVVDLNSSESTRRLDQICNGEVRREVEMLLRSNKDAADFIEAPAFAFTDLDAGGPAAGRSIGHYRIVSEIGRGGMGTVFLAVRDDGEYDQTVAIKIVSSALLGRESLERFRQERQILARLNHPNVARLLDGGVTDDGLPYLVMEYVAGVPLTEFAQENRLTLDGRLGLFLKVCRAVAYAHRNLIVHRDVKPSNVIVDSDGEPRLLDFGLAKILDLDDDAVHTRTTLRALTPAYSSPEQLRGDPISTSSDVYSLGVMLYELVTGTRPFNFEFSTLEKMIETATRSRPERPSSRLAGADPGAVAPRAVAGDIDNIVLTAMRPEPERRYRSVEQMADDIERHLHDLPISAADDTFAYRATKFIQRHKWGAAALASIVLLVASGFVLTFWQAGIARQQRDAAIAERARADDINRFLQGMFAYSNQSWSGSAPMGGSRDMTIGEMVDAIRPKVDAELAGRPAVRAQILRTIGAAYNSQGRYDAAEEALRTALALQQDTLGNTHVESLTTMNVLGETLFQQARYQEGVQLYEQLVSARRGLGGASAGSENARALAEALHGLATAVFFSGDGERSIILSREALAIVGDLELEGAERGLAAEIALNLGAFLMANGDLDESEHLLRTSLAEFRSIPGKTRWELGVALTKLGECLVYKRRFDEAARLLAESEAVYIETLGPSNSYLARNLSYQAMAALRQNDPVAAESLAERALAMLPAVQLVSSTVHAHLLVTLGESQCRTKRHSAGRNNLRSAREIFINAKASDKDITETDAAITACG